MATIVPSLFPELLLLPYVSPIIIRRKSKEDEYDWKEHFGEGVLWVIEDTNDIRRD